MYSNKDVKETPGDTVDGGATSQEGTGASGTVKVTGATKGGANGGAAAGSDASSVGGGEASSSGEPTRTEKRAARFAAMWAVPRRERRAKSTKETTPK